MSHFGINPVNGGRPPSDNNTSGVATEIIGSLVDSIGSLLIVYVLF